MRNVNASSLFCVLNKEVVIFMNITQSAIQHSQWGDFDGHVILMLSSYNSLFI